MTVSVVNAKDGVFSAQIIGARDRQEDAVAHVFFDDDSSLLVTLADGMGGHQGGEIASRAAVDTFIRCFSNDFVSIKIPYRLFGSLDRANGELDKIGRKNPELLGMGSTLLAATFSAAGVHWLSVGDSLLLRIRDRKVQRLNDDHSMVPVLEQAVKNGTLTPDQAASHKDRNALRSAVAGSTIDLVDVTDEPRSIRAGDVFLLASDGVLSLTNDEIVGVVSSQTSFGARAICTSLLAAVEAKQKRRQDNTTIAAVVISRSSKKEIGLYGLSWRSTLFAAVAAAAFFFLALTLEDGKVSLGWPEHLYSLVAGKAKAIEPPHHGKILTKPGELQPVDISEPSAPKNSVPPALKPGSRLMPDRDNPPPDRETEKKSTSTTREKNKSTDRSTLRRPPESVSTLQSGEQRSAVTEKAPERVLQLKPTEALEEIPIRGKESLEEKIDVRKIEKPVVEPQLLIPSPPKTKPPEARDDASKQGA